MNENVESGWVDRSNTFQKQTNSKEQADCSLWWRNKEEEEPQSKKSMLTSAKREKETKRTTYTEMK